MATIKSYTDINQSKKLAEILPFESADMYFTGHQSIFNPKEWEYRDIPEVRGKYIDFNNKRIFHPCWSLSSLLKYLSEIKLQVYTPILFPSEAKWILQFAEYGHGNVCEVSCENPVDACVTMIEKLHELNLL